MSQSKTEAYDALESQGVQPKHSANASPAHRLSVSSKRRASVDLATMVEPLRDDPKVNTGDLAQSAVAMAAEAGAEGIAELRDRMEELRSQITEMKAPVGPKRVQLGAPGSNRVSQTGGGKPRRRPERAPQPRLSGKTTTPVASPGSRPVLMEGELGSPLVRSGQANWSPEAAREGRARAGVEEALDLAQQQAEMELVRRRGRPEPPYPRAKESLRGSRSPEPSRASPRPSPVSRSSPRPGKDGSSPRSEEGVPPRESQGHLQG